MKQQKAVLAGAVLTILGATGAFAADFGVNVLPELPATSIPMRLPSAIPVAPMRLPAPVPAMRVQLMPVAQLKPVAQLSQLEHHLSKKTAVQPALDRFFDNVAGIPVPPIGRL